MRHRSDGEISVTPATQGGVHIAQRVRLHQTHELHTDHG
jgi:hypothetical protein